MGIRTRLMAIAVGVLLATAGMGVAHAVSDGNYDPAKQHCTADANDTANSDTAEEGCHSATATVSDQDGEYAGTGTDQTPDGEFVHSGSGWASFDTDRRPSELHAYFGADDNLDVGEHDGSTQMENGPSDGGGIQANVVPSSLGPWLAAVAAGDTGYLLTHPVPVVDAGIGACADGVCFAAQSQRRTVFQGYGDRERQVTNYEGHEWDPESCDGGSDTAADCGGKPLSEWNSQEGTVYADPGVSVYEDPDAQASPIGPYPIPAGYAGTCGVVAGGGTAPAAPDSPATNGAGQVAVNTCS